MSRTATAAAKMPNLQCYNCDRFGHVSRKCPKKQIEKLSISHNTIMLELSESTLSLIVANQPATATTAARTREWVRNQYMLMCPNDEPPASLTFQEEDDSEFSEAASIELPKFLLAKILDYISDEVENKAAREAALRDFHELDQVRLKSHDTKDWDSYFTRAAEVLSNMAEFADTTEWCQALESASRLARYASDMK